MILNLENTKLYIVKCSDWAVAVASDNHEEACTQAIDHMLMEVGKELKISCVMISIDVEDHLEMEPDQDDSTCFHTTSKILANAGHHKIAKSVKAVFGT